MGIFFARKCFVGMNSVHWTELFTIIIGLFLPENASLAWIVFIERSWIVVGHLFARKCYLGMNSVHWTELFRIMIGHFFARKCFVGMNSKQNCYKSNAKWFGAFWTLFGHTTSTWIVNTIVWKATLYDLAFFVSGGHPSIWFYSTKHACKTSLTKSIWSERI